MTQVTQSNARYAHGYILAYIQASSGLSESERFIAQEVITLCFVPPELIILSCFLRQILQT